MPHWGALALLGHETLLLRFTAIPPARRAIALARLPASAEVQPARSLSNELHRRGGIASVGLDQQPADQYHGELPGARENGIRGAGGDLHADWK